VPFAAGSYTDTIVRMVSPALGEKLQATIVVDNRPGANGIIAADAVAKSAKDGLTLLMGGTSANAANPGLYKSLPYDPVNDLVPVARFGVLPFLLVVNSDVPAKTVPELIDYAKQNPGKLAYATPNSVTLVGMETFKRGAGVDILSVPYKSSPQAMLDLVGGRVQVLIADFATAMPHVKAGKARVIAVTMPKRSPLLPDVPAVADVVKGYDISAWNGLFAPAGTPREMLVRIGDAVTAVLGTREMQEKLSTVGFDVAPMGPDAFGPYVREQITTWGRLIRETGITPE
jgi:tripartite-type tricarboxylate transporter receptor subunit TctC